MIALLMTFALIQDPLADHETGKIVQVGDRLMITFKSGGSLRGLVTAPRRAKNDYDPSVSKDLMIDLKLDHIRLNGTMTVERHTIKRVEILKPLSKKKIQEILARKKIAANKLTQEELARIDEQDARYKEYVDARSKAISDAEAKGKEVEEAADIAKREEEDSAALRFYLEYPESAGWGPEKHTELKEFLQPTYIEEMPYIDFRKPVGDSYAPADVKEARFLLYYNLWQRGKMVHAKQEALRKESEKKPEGPPSSEKP